MELQTISQVTSRFGISTRTLRYYEQIGLLPCVKLEGYAYRMYDEEGVRRLQQILLLKKLRVPLKQIGEILDSGDGQSLMEALQENLLQVNNEMEALKKLGETLQAFINRIFHKALTDMSLDFLMDEETLTLVDSVTAGKVVKEAISMEEIKNIVEEPLELKDVRIVYLAPATVASCRFVGDNPEHEVHKVIDKFVRDSGLARLKPDFRHYGFNHPDPVDETGAHGYEVWVTIPEDMELPEGLEKKTFPGGLYAAHMIKMGDFHEWEWLINWMMKSDQYEFRPGDPQCMNGLIEEHLNYIGHYMLENSEPEGMQMDLLLPIQEK